MPWPLGFVQPPVEILQQIFDRTFPPHYLLEQDHALDEFSYACLVTSEQKSHMSVCKEWYNIVKPYLYEYIQIRHPIQLFLLLKSLKQHPDNQSLIKVLHINCMISITWQHKFGKTLQSVVDRAPNLREFSMRRWNLPWADSCSIPCGLRFPVFKHEPMSHLKIVYDSSLKVGVLSRDFLDHGSGVFDRLTQLSLDVNIQRYFADRQDRPLKVNLPRLETLECRYRFLGLKGTWRMPRLRRVMLQLPTLRPPSVEELSGILKEFFTAHGKGLKELQLESEGGSYLISTGYNPGPALDVLDLAILCPSLDHLILDGYLIFGYQTFAHPALRWIDVWCAAPTDRNWRPEIEAYYRDIRNRYPIGTQLFPSLRRVRILDYQLHHLQDLPYRLPPWSVISPRDSYEVRFMDLCIIHEVGGVYAFKPPEESGYGSEDSSYDGGEWEYATSSGYETSGSELREMSTDEDGGLELFSGFDSD
ncbi:hypothetical protein CC1G_04509 [Coprinopsis cinerea okayama7|uniref:Uncharacterized protein n=1 Tax=Coprinopsis cinerea (strain Okayama-7 / 130 / ATCC MYA-4618 / FGSC 9003) TaxID=240176 RepID=A8N5D1_COPC7|nr:hypothetical protein CC1G_04509 [Coprinopsis cinerea okayama7\|eukprot:XP_001830076.2 hypothetical protein CC1G_04509 [Coprinopsis cinerea okayama7\